MMRDQNVNARDLVIVEKYEATVTYLYPILQSFPRKHGCLRDQIIGLVFEMVGLLYQAAKSKQASRLYAADAHLATLRYWMRFACGLKLLSHHQHQVALRYLAETGALLGAWIRDAKGNGRSGQ